MTARIYVKPLTRLWLPLASDSRLPAVMPAFNYKVTVGGMRAFWVALACHHAEYFDWLPWPMNDNGGEGWR